LEGQCKAIYERGSSTGIFLFVILNFYTFEDIKWGYSEAVTGRPTIQWQNEKGKTRDQKSTTTKYTEKSRLRNTNPTKKGSELGCF
jgi:hypothetical protein